MPLTQNVGTNVGTKMTKTDNSVFELLKNNRNMTASDMAAEIGVDVRTIERGLKKLEDNGFIEHVGPTKSGEWKILK